MKRQASIIQVRNKHIDALKGLAIILIVLEHAFMTYIPLFDNNIIFRYFASFGVALFMFLSGLLTYGKNIDLTRKFQQLVIPFLVWYQIGYVYRTIVTWHADNYLNYMWKWIVSPDWGLWFLWALFLIFAVMRLIQTLSNPNNKYSELIISLLAYLLLLSCPTPAFGIGHMRWYFFFFAVGYFLRKYQGKIKFSNLQKNSIKTVILIAYLIGARLWYRLHLPVRWDIVVNFFRTYKLPGLHTVEYSYMVAVPTLGILTSYLFMPKNSVRRLYTALCWLGTQSMQIYILHFYFTYGIGQGYMSVATATITSISASLITSKIIERLAPNLSQILFGMRPQVAYVK